MPVLEFPAKPSAQPVADPYPIHSMPLNTDALKAAIFEPDGEQKAVNQHITAFDSANGRQSKAEREIQSGKDKLYRLNEDMVRVRRKISRTKDTKTIVTDARIAKRPRLHNVLPAFYIASSIVAIAISNTVGAAFVVRSGSDVYAADSWGTKLFYVVPFLAALMIKTYEARLPHDLAKAWFRASFFALGLGSFFVWALMSAQTFAPEAGNQTWIAATAPDWISAHSGAILLLSHTLVDCAGGFLIFSAGTSMWVSDRVRITQTTDKYLWLKNREAEIDAATAAVNEISAAAEEYLRKLAATRIALEQEVRFAVRRFQKLHASKATTDFLST